MDAVGRPYVDHRRLARQKPFSREACVRGAPFGPPLQHTYHRSYLLCFLRRPCHRLECLSKPDDYMVEDSCLYRVRTDVAANGIRIFPARIRGVGRRPFWQKFCGRQKTSSMVRSARWALYSADEMVPSGDAVRKCSASPGHVDGIAGIRATAATKCAAGGDRRRDIGRAPSHGRRQSTIDLDVEPRAPRPARWQVIFRRRTGCLRPAP
jgi:hypothetical protein